MVKVKEFPFASLNLVRLLQELRVEMNLPFADIERFEEAEKRLGIALKSIGQTAGQGAARGRAARNKLISQTADNLGNAVREAVETLRSADKDDRKQAIDPLRRALKQASDDMKALSEVAHDARDETLADLSAQIKDTIADLKRLAKNEKSD